MPTVQAHPAFSGSSKARRFVRLAGNFIQNKDDWRVVMELLCQRLAQVYDTDGGKDVVLGDADTPPPENEQAKLEDDRLDIMDADGLDDDDDTEQYSSDEDYVQEDNDDQQDENMSDDEH